ncbi:MAG TPA: hypothetical protein EYQ27_11780 [Gemmatimonadetes bacterium]|nr:hypothetical protein [Gemmatimonadota bacterium]
MNRRTIVAAIVAAAALSAAPVAAQNLTGTWELSQETQRGARTSTLTLVQDGSGLTGTLTLTLGGRRGGGGGGGGAMEVSVDDGMVDGNSFSFSVTLTFGDNSITQSYSGTFDGDSMEGGIEGGGRRGGGGGPRPFTGKRRG